MCVLGRFWVARDGNLVPRNVSKGGISYNALWAQGQEVSLRKSRSQGTLSICQLCFFSGFFLHFSLCLSSIQQTFTEISLVQFLTSSATARVKHNSRVIPRPIIQNACSWGTVWQVEGGVFLPLGPRCAYILPFLFIQSLDCPHLTWSHCPTSAAEPFHLLSVGDSLQSLWAPALSSLVLGPVLQTHVFWATCVSPVQVWAGSDEACHHLYPVG